MTTKKKHLIELMIEAGVKWPAGAEYAAQDKKDNKVQFYKNGKPNPCRGFDEWMGDKCTFMNDKGITLPSLCRNWNKTIVTREQYAEALATTAMTPAVQPDGEWEPVEWGNWKMGDTVRFDGFTAAMYDHWNFEVGTLYVIGKRNTPIAGNGQQPSSNWGFSFSRRKKQNEQHIEVQPSSEYCASVMRQMPNNTIEQLTADYHAKAEEADRLQSVADEARKAADDALLALERAGELLCLVISIDTKPKQAEQQRSSEEWKVGDKCIVTDSPDDADFVGRECVIIGIDAVDNELPYRVSNQWDWELWVSGIRRP